MKLKHMLQAVTLALTMAMGGGSAAQTTPDFALGADVGWISQQEASGYSFLDSQGVKSDPFVLLRNRNVNAIRLRVWVNPADGWNSGVDVLAKARRAAAQGQRIMIDFHYSDTWADPGKQAKPVAWANHTLKQLNHDVWNHTTGILSYLKANGIKVEWVQVGNEINGGMMWPEGATSNFGNLAGLINSGYNATKSVYPEAQVIVHLANGYKTVNSRDFFEKLRYHGGKWDITGLSHYPPPNDWANYNNMISTTMWDLAGRHSKPVMIVEVGMDWQQANTSKAMLTDLIAKTRALGPRGQGVFYWEPQGHPGWQGYTMGAIDASGKFTVALDAFR